MNSENIKQITHQAIERLVMALNEGQSEMLTQYLAPRRAPKEHFETEPRD